MQELEDLCRKEFGVPDDTRLFFTTADISISQGRHVEIHRGPGSWEAMSEIVQRVTAEMTGNAYHPFFGVCFIILFYFIFRRQVQNFYNM